MITRRAYCTLNDIVKRLMIEEASFSTTTEANDRIDAQDTNVRNQLKDFIFEVSDDLFEQWYRDFLPYTETFTIYFDEMSDNAFYRERGNYVLDLSKFHNRDLLSVSSITLGGTSISSSYYRLDTRHGYPAQRIIFDSSNVSLPSSYDFDTSIVIVGTWGYHLDPSAMWQDSGDTVQNNPLAIGGTTLTVASGTNFETYQYIQIDSEVLFITSISTNDLTVERGALGTTATAHTQTTAISTYRQTASVRKEVERMVLREFQLRNGIEVVIGGETVADLTGGKFILQIPKRWSVGSA